MRKLSAAISGRAMDYASPCLGFRRFARPPDALSTHSKVAVVPSLVSPDSS